MDLETPVQDSLPLFETKRVDWRKEVPSVSQLTRRVRGLLEGTFPDTWVKGEISGFRKPGSGHAYFTLKDATAQLRAVLFRPSLMKVKFQLQDGMEVLLHGKLTVYEARGDYQLIADTVEPVGVGALQLAFEQLKAKLHKEGLFDPARKRPLPFLPRRIGLVTSSTGAAVRDVLKVLDRRFRNLDIVIFPCLVQGDRAACDIAAALKSAERWNLERPERALDLLIVGRGGGSLEDLWCFNEETVARAIAACPIPTISAVGHEIDFTIADFVADLRAATPSAAAEIAVPSRTELEAVIEHQRTKLRILVLRRIEQLKLHLDHLTRRLVDPRVRVKQMREHFRRVEAQLYLAMRTTLKFGRQRLEGLVQKLDLLSPLQVLGRGYSITQDATGVVVRSASEVKAGSLLVTRFKDGTVRSRAEAQDRTS